MKSQNKKTSAGRPPTYKEVVFLGGESTKQFFDYLKTGEKVMLSFMAGKTKIQLGIFKIVKMKGYEHFSPADGSKRKLKAFNRAKFAPTKEFKEIVKHL